MDERIVKLLVVGEFMVGKTSAIIRFVDGKFKDDTRSSVTVIPCQVETGCSVNQLVVSVQVAPFVLSNKATRARESCAGTWADRFLFTPDMNKKIIPLIIEE